MLLIPLLEVHQRLTRVQRKNNQPDKVAEEAIRISLVEALHNKASTSVLSVDPLDPESDDFLAAIGGLLAALVDNKDDTVLAVEALIRSHAGEVGVATMNTYEEVGAAIADLRVVLETLTTNELTKAHAILMSSGATFELSQNIGSLAALHARWATAVIINLRRPPPESFEK